LLRDTSNLETVQEQAKQQEVVPTSSTTRTLRY
jgi:hypothetical protein